MFKISFIVTCYNLKDYIERCLQSILNQSLKEIEIIVIDDESTDGTINIINKLCKNDHRVKIITQKNSGANAARKAGLKEATSEYVIFVDGDDWVDINMAKELYDVIRKENYDIITYGFQLSYDDSSKNTNSLCKIYHDIEGNKFLELLLLQKIWHTLWNKIYKRSLLIECNFDSVCNTSMGEDLAANVLIALKKPKVKMIENTYYYYYQRSSSTMNNVTDRLLEIVQSTEYIEYILKENNLLSEYKQEMEYLWFVNCYYYNIISADTKRSKYHKMLFKKWKNKKIDIYSNKYCKESIDKKIKVLNCCYNINYYFGDFVRSLHRLKIKITHKERQK